MPSLCAAFIKVCPYALPSLRYAIMHGSPRGSVPCAAFVKVCHYGCSHQARQYCGLPQGTPLCAAFLKAGHHRGLLQGTRQPYVRGCHLPIQQRCRAWVLYIRSFGVPLANTATLQGMGTLLPSVRGCHLPIQQRCRAWVPFRRAARGPRLFSVSTALPSVMATGQPEPLLFSVVHSGLCYPRWSVLLSRGGYTPSGSPLSEGDGGTVGTLHVLTALPRPAPIGRPRGAGGGSEARYRGAHQGCRAEPPLAATACVRVSPSRLGTGATQGRAVVT